MKTKKDVEEVNQDKQKTDVCPDTQHPTLTNKQRGNEVTVRPATLDGKQPYKHTYTQKQNSWATENDWSFSQLCPSTSWQLRVTYRRWLHTWAKVTISATKIRVSPFYCKVTGFHERNLSFLDSSLLSQQDERGFTPLMWAAAFGEIAVVNFLLDQVRYYYYCCCFLTFAVFWQACTFPKHKLRSLVFLVFLF